MPLDLASPFCPSRMLMRSNNGAIDGVLVPIDLSSRIALLLQGFQHALPNASLLPPIKAAGYRAPRAIVVGQISPGRSGSQNPQDSIDNQTMILCWTTYLWLLWR